MVGLAVGTGAAVVAVLAALERAGAQARPRGEMWEFFCPVHADGQNRAGELRQGDKGALIVCHAGCDRGLLVERLGLTMADLFDEKRAARTDWENPDARYVYRDEHGEVLYEVRRIGFGDGKQIRPFTRVNGQWEMTLPARRVLYRLPELVDAVAAEHTVFICEGERDCDTAHALGHAATTNVGGAKKWRKEYDALFAGADVVVVQDRDKPGYEHAQMLREHLEGVAGQFRIVEAATGKDLADHVSAGGDVETLALVYPLPVAEEDKPQPDQDIDTFLNDDEPDYDWVIPGLLERGDRVILTGAEGSGKALAADTPIPCRTGWTTMGKIRPGDDVFSEDGSLTRVLAVTDLMLNRPCYRVTFSDGSSIVADAGHLWKTETLMSREASSKARSRGPTKLRGTDQTHKRRHFPALVTTEAMADTVSARHGHALNHSIPTCEPLDLPAADLPIDPYILGAWLGDGHSAGARLTCADPAIIQRIRDKGQPCWKNTSKYAWGLSGSTRVGLPVLQVRLRQSGLLNNKHIPSQYLRASPDQRLELLQGLMDTDGTTSPTGVCEFSVCNERLARGVQELLVGLGIKTTWCEGPAKIDGRLVGTRYRLSFQTHLAVFSLPRKARRLLPARTRRPFLRYVVSVVPVESVLVRCIQVEHPSGMFLAGTACIPTHNSTLLRQIAIQCGAGIHPFTLDPMTPIRVMYVDLENSKRQVRRKIRPLRLVVKDLDPLMIRVRIVTQGIDLLRPDHQEFLEERIKVNAPDLLIMGPLYKLVGDDPVKEEPARVAAMVLDRLRAKYGFALLMEAHSPHAVGASHQRPERPYGASLWMRWPEFGFFIDGESGQLRHWRGPRDERDWPAVLQRSGEWPWTAVTNVRAVTFAKVLDAVRAAGRKLSERALADMLGCSASQIHRTITANRKQFDEVVRGLAEEEF